MLYGKNSAEKLDLELFRNPTSEYRGTPFWAWNCKLDQKQLTEQIDCLKEMGFGGFHMHSRSGMATEYLSDEFMELVKGCVEKAKQEGMLAWLYDEDRWPSGAAGGLVTKNPAYRQRTLVFTYKRLKQETVSFEEAAKTGKPSLLGAYSVRLNARGELEEYHFTEENDPQANWFTYIVTPPTSGWYNNQTYVDTLSKEAIDAFINITEEAYKRAVGADFGKTVPAIFTDEPQFASKQSFAFAESKQTLECPWTVTFTDTFQQKYGYDILEKLPELFWELPDGAVSVARYHYHDHITERFTEAFAKNCGNWCAKNGIALTGHLVEEPTLESQTKSVGEAMRAYPHFGIPGIDMLCNLVELTTAKQTQSIVHQNGKEGMLSELYGVTNWDFDFRGHKFQGDWQAALGVTVRVPHLSWVSMGGAAKRDYPASISYQSPWYKEYRYVEDHFARVNTALTRGKPVVKVGVIHPIESYWLHFGPRENTADVRRQLDEQFQNITAWLLNGLIDFDFISESLLPGQCSGISDVLKLGCMEYSTVLVPGCETLRNSTLEILKQFKARGGTVIFAGNPPKYVDAVPSDEAREFYLQCETVSFDKVSILRALEPERIVEIRNKSGENTDNLIYNMRQDGDCRWLFIAHTDSYIDSNFMSAGCSIDMSTAQETVIRLKGEYTPLVYDTLTGTVKEIPFEIKDGYTLIPYNFYANDSLLLHLEQYDGRPTPESAPPYEVIKTIDIKDRVAYSLSEPNVLLLDMAEYALDDGEYQPVEEILRLDSALRDQIGFINNETQPWTIEEEPISHYIHLRFQVESQLEITGAKLAVENAEALEVCLNGVPVEMRVDGYFTDKAIQTVKLPAIKEGINILTMKVPFGPRTNTEWCYILGDFGVKAAGCTKVLVPREQRIAFSSVVPQGLPFYGANITYHTEVELPEGDIVIHANHYRGAMMKVYVDGEARGVIAYAPYELRINGLKAGKHRIDYELFGNRHNSFGALHNADILWDWFGPDAWRTAGDKWCYEYRLKEFGILASPVIKVIQS